MLSLSMTRTEERKAEISERATADRTALEETYQDDCTRHRR